jgi:hypothetical protein
MFSGGVGGMSLWIAIFPTDVVKSRIQVESTIGKKAPSFYKTFIMIYNNEGRITLYIYMVVTVAEFLKRF